MAGLLRPVAAVLVAVLLGGGDRVGVAADAPAPGGEAPRAAAVARGGSGATSAGAAAHVSGAAGPNVSYVPAAMSRCRPGSIIPPAPDPPPDGWSEVLAYVPRFPGSALAFFARDLDEAAPAVVALYDVAGATGSEVAEWYWDNLPPQGWTLADDADDYREWARGDAWLIVQPEYEVGGNEYLRLVRDAGGARSAPATALDGAVPLPPHVERWRYDRADYLTEEWRLPLDPEAAGAAMAELLADFGWRETAAVDVGAARMIAYSDDRQSVVIGLWSRPGGESELALGRGECLPADDGGGTAAWRSTSVYLADVPAPPGARLTGYRRGAVEAKALETWTSDCADIDLLTAALSGRLASGSWSQPLSLAARYPGEGHVVALPADDSDPVSFALRSLDGSSAIDIALSRAESGRRLPTGASLLFDDLPLPPGADARELQIDTADGWGYSELYALPEGLDGPPFFKEAMPANGWTFERGSAIEADSPLQVYFADGEEVIVAFPASVPGTVRLARRRVCESAEPVPPDDVGTPSRHLLEMQVYPGAQPTGYAGGSERHYLACAGLDLVSQWYRTAMEAGDWSLAGTVGPDDPFHRELLFVRPGERPLPPEERTAWAEVLVDRDWPYQYTLTLRRDPGGVRTSPGPRDTARRDTDAR